MKSMLSSTRKKNVDLTQETFIMQKQSNVLYLKVKNWNWKTYNC